MKKAIVLGSFGFIGYGLCCRLLELDVDVYGVDFLPNETSIEEEKLLLIGRNANFKMVDIESFSKEFDILQGVDVVFYPLCEYLRSEGHDETLAMLKDIISYCDAKNWRFVLVTDNDLSKNVDTDHLQPIINTIEGLEQLHHTLDYLIIKIPTVYGPWQPEHFVYQQAITSTIEDEEFEINMREETSDLLYIDDAINGILLIESKCETQNEYQLISGKDDQWDEGARIISNLLNLDDIMGIEYKTKEASTTGCYIIQTPSIHLEDGIKRQIEHVKSLKKRLKE